MADIIQNRRGTAAAWTSANPTLASGEFGLETDTEKIKMGDGTTAWTSLSYWVGSTAVGDVHGPSSSTDNTVARFDSTGGKTIQGSGIVIDDNDKMSSVKAFSFSGEYSNGVSGTAKTINFANGQKQYVELNSGTVTLTMSYPGVGNYVLRIKQNATTQCTGLTIAGSPLYPDGDIKVGGDASSITLLSIYYNGTTQHIMSVPDLETGTVSFT